MSTDIQPISRVTRPRRAAQATYDAIAPWYDLIEGVWEKPLRAACLDLLRVTMGEKVLEIGPGPGHDLLTLSQATGTLGSTVGLDLSPRMLALAHERMRRAGRAHLIHLTRGDAIALPFAAGAFDAIFMSFALELFDTPEIPVLLAGCRRALRSGGRMAVVSLSKAGHETVMRRLYEWGHRALPQVLDCRPIYVQASMEAAGFQTVQAVRRSMWGLPVELVVGKRA